MSFMKGFGNAFSQSFETQQRIGAQEREDLFRMTYQEFVKKREKMDEMKKEDTRAASKAKSLIEGYGNIPPEATNKVYAWIKAGVDDSEIARRLETGKFEVKQKGAEKEVSMDTPTNPGVDSQMAEIQGNQSMAPQSPVSDNPIKGFFDTMRNKRQEKNYNQTIEKIGGASGMTPDEVQKTLSGSPESAPVDDSNVSFTPGAPAHKPDQFASMNEAYIEQAQARSAGDPERIRVAEERVNALLEAQTATAEAEARAKGLSVPGAPVTVWKDGRYQTTTRATRTPDGKGYVDIFGQPIEGQVIPVSEQEQKAKAAIAGSIGKPLQEQNARVANQMAAVRAYGTMSDIIERSNGAVLAPMTSSVFQTAQKWVVDAATFADQIQQQVGKGIEITDKDVDYLQKAEEKLLSEDQSDLGTQKGLYEIQKALLAYRLGAAMGQDGRNLSEPERKIFSEIASGGVTPDRFHQGMSDLLMNGIRDIDTQGEQIIQGDPNFQDFQSTYKYAPIRYEYAQKQLEQTTDPDLKKAWATLQQFDRRNMEAPALNTGKNPETATPPAQDIPTVSSPEEALKLPSGTVFITPDGRRKVRP